MNATDLTTVPVGRSAAVIVSADVAGTGMTGVAVRSPAGHASVTLTLPQVVDTAVGLLDQTPGAWEQIAAELAARAHAEAVAA